MTWTFMIIVTTVFARASFYEINSDCSHPDLGVLNKASASKLLNQKFIFKGVYDGVFGELETRYENQTLTVSITNDNPHSYYRNRIYLSVLVMDDSGKKIYDRDVYGSVRYFDRSHNIVSMKIGYTIKIFHEETRTRLYSPEGIVDKESTTNTFLVTRYGLKNLKLRNDPLHGFIKKLANYTKALNDPKQWFDTENKVQLLIAVRSLPQPYRTQFVLKHGMMKSDCAVQFTLGQASDYNEQGTLNVILRHDGGNLIGTMIYIRNGDEIVTGDVIQVDRRLFENQYIAYGVYSVEFVGPSAEEYFINPQYIEVKQHVNRIVFDFEKIKNITFLGKSNSVDDLVKYVERKGKEISKSAFRSSLPLYLSDEKKMLLVAIRALPESRTYYYLEKYRALFARSEN